MASEYKLTNKYLKEYGKSVVQEIRTRLRNNDKVAGGDLYDSIKYEVTENTTKISISFNMLYYGMFVDKGVRGSESGRAGQGGTSPYRFTNKMPPKESIEKWLKIKGIPENASYPIRRNIFRFGITPTNFFTIPTTRRAKELNKKVKEKMIEDVENAIKKMFPKKK